MKTLKPYDVDVYHIQLSIGVHAVDEVEAEAKAHRIMSAVEGVSIPEADYFNVFLHDEEQDVEMHAEEGVDNYEEPKPDKEGFCHDKGRITFSFDFDLAYKTEDDWEKALAVMMNYWYDSQETELRNAMLFDMGPFKDNIKLNIANATVERS